MIFIKKKIFYISIFLNLLLLPYYTYANDSQATTTFLTKSELQKKNSNIFPIDIKCNNTNSFSQTHNWYKNIENIKLYLDVDQYFRSIIKKIKLPIQKITGQDDSLRTWSKYKKGKIQFNKSKCKHSIKYRLTGDLSDHVGLNKELPHSLKIKLLDTSVGDIIKFKLLNPKTRSGKYEILNVIIHKKLNFLAPRSAFTQVQIGNQKYEAIFQEDITKEFLENNKIHDAILFEGDEALLPFTIPRIINKNIVNNNYFKKISRDAQSILGRSYLMTNFSKILENKDDPLLLIDYLPEKDKNKFQLFYLLNYALISSIGLTPDDFRIVYDHVSGNFSPIYYDGHSGWPNKTTTFSFTETQREYLIDKISNLDIQDLILETNKYGAKFYKSEILKVKNEALKILKSLNSYQSKKNINKIVNEENIERYLKEGSRILWEGQDPKFDRLNKSSFSWTLKNNKVKKCHISQVNLEDVNYDFKCEFTKINLNLEYPLVSQDPKNIFIHGLNQIDPKTNFFDRILKNKLKIGNNSSYIEFTENLILDIKKKEKLVLIKQKEDSKIDAQIKVYGGLLKDWKFITLENTFLNYKRENNTRVSRFGLTGCITFHDIQLINISVNIHNSNCEDGVHFVRSSGSIKEILINNSSSDALDADFSDLDFDIIRVSNAGNDCIDLSNGRYSINILTANKCNDKGLSAGENSLVNLNKTIIEKASIGLVSKDNSELTVKEASITNTTICLAVYQKKQQYRGGIININPHKINCNGIPSYVHKFSKIIFKN